MPHCSKLVLAILLGWPSMHAAQNLFQFRNGFWINFHHYLYAEALAGSDSARGRLRSSAEDVIRKAPCKAIPDDKRAAWQKAIDYYRANYVQPDWLFVDDMRRLNDTMGDASDSDDPPTGLPAELRQALQRAAPAYRAACWAEHRRANAEWIASLEKKLAQHGPPLAKRLLLVYEAKWPERLVVDAVAYANWAGAYTYRHHITVSSANPDYQDDSLEMIFHETSHALEGKLFDEVDAEFKRRKAEMPRDFDHALIFFTAGILVKQELAKTDPSYLPYADRLGIYKRVPHWTEYEAALQRTWEPYLEGNKPRKEAIAELVEEVSAARK
jgi:hypothetical protein